MKLNKEQFKNIHDYEKWENSIEGVMYQLKVIGDTTSQDEKDKFLIAKTLLKLPKKIRERVLDEVAFIVLTVQGAIWNYFTVKSIEKKDLKKIGKHYFVEIEQPLIILNFDNMRKSKNDRMVTVAHEIAHFILGHYKAEKRHSKNNEKEADDLIEKWGFQRAYKSYENRMKN